jgi:hypothetical protein
MLILEFIPMLSVATMTPKWTSPSVPEGSATNGGGARPDNEDVGVSPKMSV